jgi:hypothetical protein
VSSRRVYLCRRSTSVSPLSTIPPREFLHLGALVVHMPAHIHFPVTPHAIRTRFLLSGTKRAPSPHAFGAARCSQAQHVRHPERRATESCASAAPCRPPRHGLAHSPRANQPLDSGSGSLAIDGIMHPYIQCIRTLASILTPPSDADARSHQAAPGAISAHTTSGRHGLAQHQMDVPWSRPRQPVSGVGASKLFAKRRVKARHTRRRVLPPQRPTALLDSSFAARAGLGQYRSLGA